VLNNIAVDTALPNFDLNLYHCPEELATYVHGIWSNEKDAIEQYKIITDSYKQALKSIDSNIQFMPVILYT
jgi:hypothetical protein